MVKEYDLFVPFYYDEGRQVEPQKVQALQQRLLAQFSGLTFFPQPHEGFWTLPGITHGDEIVIYRVTLLDAHEARRFLSELKERLKTEFHQEDMLIVEREIETL
jgi:hypothetical protein